MSETAEIILTAHETRLVNLWNSGTSTQEIMDATKLGRSAVAGAIYRLRKRGVDLKSRVQKSERPKVYERKAPMPKEIVSKPMPTFAPAPVVGPGIPFEESNGCMWPLWGIEHNKGNVCGCAQLVLEEGTRRERKSSYCLTHHTRAYPGFAMKK